MEKHMKYSDHERSVEKGIEHVGERRADRAIELLNSNLGSREGCLSNVLMHAEAQCLMAWFKRKDLKEHKQWAYVAAKTQRMIFQIEPWRWFPAFKHLYALLYDNESIVSWYAGHRVPFFIQDEERGNEALNKDDPSLVTFHSYQALLALRGNWEELRRRCEHILSLPETPGGKDYLVDHRFYLALANGDKTGMETALNYLTSPEVAKNRNREIAFGLTENLIATHATIYAKIAWRYGFEVAIESPWVPREWLPVEPLQQYDDPWSFMQSFDIWQPFEGGWAGWSPKQD